jgi:hypothetical protein
MSTIRTADCYQTGWKPALLGLALLVSAAGCGGGPPLASVSGKVTCQGAAVDGGTLIFSPLTEDTMAAGRPGQAQIQSDGSYTVSTERPGDGVVLGKHRVTFTPPEQQLTPEQRTDPNYNAPPPRYAGYGLKDAEVEVHAGSNTINIELVPPPSAAMPMMP